MSRQLFYSREDWDLMQAAHVHASSLLHRSARDHKDADRLARRVMLLFDRGMRDMDIIAKVAAHQEHMAAMIVAQSDRKAP